jgi:cytochrome c-type biogenesis protein CcmE
MSQNAPTSWEKPQNDQLADARLAKLQNRRGQRLQMALGGGLLLIAIIILITNATALGQQYYMSVEELVNTPEYDGQSVRITGAVIGDTIKETTVDGKTVIDFTIATIPIQTSNLAEDLSIAANNPDVLKLKVHIEGQPRPELLKHEAQAILVGELGDDGVFYATNMQFKCPSRFEERAPEMGEQDHPGMQTQGGSA